VAILLGILPSQFLTFRDLNGDALMQEARDAAAVPIYALTGPDPNIRVTGGTLFRGHAETRSMA
jgi:hypothetical protein